jgi:hypothetical protein
LAGQAEERSDEAIRLDRPVALRAPRNDNNLNTPQPPVKEEAAGANAQNDWPRTGLRLSRRTTFRFDGDTS